MENTLVSARVPKAKKEEAARILAAQDATMSDLINAAIDGMITGTWPGKPDSGTGVRPSQEDFERFVKRSTLGIDWPENTPDDYRELEREWMLRGYESLA